MKKVLAIVALALSVFFGGSAAAQPEPPHQPEAEGRTVNQNACDQTNPGGEGVYEEAPPPAQLGIPHDEGHTHHETGEELGCHHATGTFDPRPNNP
jgi:hypothetical protein